MEAGRSTQQHSDLALVYPRSKALQSYLTEYFIVVVQICLRFHRFAQRSALGKLTSSLSDTDIKDARSSLLAWSKSIQAEISLLVAQRIESEAENGSRFRTLMVSTAKSHSQQQKQIALRKLLDSCSTHDYETAWRQIRKCGNTSLYKQLPEYNQWLAGPASKTLILVGKLGYGKSVTLANIVDDLYLRTTSVSSGLAYFFCRHDVPESMDAKTVIGALMRQFIHPLGHHLFDEPIDAETHGFSRLLDLMRRAIPPRYVGYVVLDGLDLCSARERKTITEQLELMRNSFHLYLCVSRRLDPETELLSIAPDFPKADIVRLPDNSSDIEAFITARLELAISNQSLTLGDPTIVLEIQDALLQGSRGMFLWVVLQIQSLCTIQTDHKIREALADLPRGLSQIYSRILRQAKSNYSFQAVILKLIIAARRPLTVHEMREALSVTPGDTTWNPSKLLNSISPALATCGCLITVDEEEYTLRTVHPSVNQFLLRGDSISRIIDKYTQFTMEDAKTLIFSIIVTYLGYGIFETAVAVRLPALNVGPAPSRIINSTAGKSRGVQSMALKLLRSRKQPSFDASRTLAHEFTRRTPPSMEDFHLKDYAHAYIMRHARTFPVVSCNVLDSFFRLLELGKLCINPHKDASGLLWLMLQPYAKADIIGIFESMNVQLDHEIYYGRKTVSRLFRLAIRTGNIRAVQYLLAVYRPFLLNYKGATREEEKAVHQELRNFCNRQYWFSDRDFTPSRHQLSECFFGSASLNYAMHERQDAIAKVMISCELIDINEVAAVPDSDTWDTPIGIAMKQQDMGNLKLLLSPKVRARLVLTVAEAQGLLDQAKNLGDGSVASLCEDYVAFLIRKIGNSSGNWEGSRTT